MAGFLADALTVAGLLLAYAGAATLLSVCAVAAGMKVKELWSR